MSAYVTPILNVLLIFGVVYAGKKIGRQFFYTKEELIKDLNQQSKSGGQHNV